MTPIEATFLTPSQVQLLLDAANGSRYAPLFALLINTALRRGEALALRWTDVDFEAKLLHVRGTLVRGLDGRLTVTQPKTAKGRRVLPLSDPAIRILHEVRTVQAAERLAAGTVWHRTPYVFTTWPQSVAGCAG